LALESENSSLRSTVASLNSEVASLEYDIVILQSQASSTGSTSGDAQSVADWAEDEFRRIWNFLNDLTNRIYDIEQRLWNAEIR